MLLQVDLPPSSRSSDVPQLSASVADQVCLPRICCRALARVVRSQTCELKCFAMHDALFTSISTPVSSATRMVKL